MGKEADLVSELPLSQLLEILTKMRNTGDGEGKQKDHHMVRSPAPTLTPACNQLLF